MSSAAPLACVACVAWHHLSTRQAGTLFRVVRSAVGDLQAMSDVADVSEDGVAHEQWTATDLSEAIDPVA